MSDHHIDEATFARWTGADGRTQDAHLHVALPRQMKGAIDDAAARENSTRSAWVRRALAEALRRQKGRR